MESGKTLHGSTFSILGDSYSTFEGFIPQGNAVYYPRVEAVPDMTRVEDTWWHILMTEQHMTLLLNNSYSGATVCTHTRDGQPPASAFTERAKLSFSGELQPDFLFVFGGTNDSWLDRAVGQVKFTGRTEEDLKKTLPAYCQVLEHLVTHNPNTTVVAVVNTGLKPEIHAGILQAAAHYGCRVVELSGIHKTNGHPNVPGMRQIARQIADALQ
jgi:hypothetical protein